MVPAMCHTNPRLFYLLYVPAIDTDIYGASNVPYKSTFILLTLRASHRYGYLWCQQCAIQIHVYFTYFTCQP